MSSEDVAGIRQELAVLTAEMKNFKATLEEIANGKFAHCATQVARIGALEEKAKHIEAKLDAHLDESNKGAKDNWQWSWRLVIGVVITAGLGMVTTAVIGVAIAKAVFKT